MFVFRSLVINGAELIRWRIVCHAFIDGKTGLVTGAHFSNSNCAGAAMDLFMNAVNAYGLPSRVRGDHGTENILAAEYMGERPRPRFIYMGGYVHAKTAVHAS